MAMPLVVEAEVTLRKDMANEQMGKYGSKVKYRKI